MFAFPPLAGDMHGQTSGRDSTPSPQLHHTTHITPTSASPTALAYLLKTALTVELCHSRDALRFRESMTSG